MEDLVLTLEQALHLKKLGFKIDEPNLWWRQAYPLKENKILLIDKEEMKMYEGHDWSKHFKFTPTYTSQEIWEKLPEEIVSNWKKYQLELHKYGDGNSIVYEDYEREAEPIYSAESVSVIDLMYETLCWTIENGYLETE